VIAVTAVVMNLFKIVDTLLNIYKLIFGYKSLLETYLKADLPTNQLTKQAGRQAGRQASKQASKRASNQPTDKLTN